VIKHNAPISGIDSWGGKYVATAGLPRGIEIHHRDDLDVVQRELRATPGLTVLIYDQTCAAEKRRRRKRGAYPDLPKRAFINDAVCEGCGDCSDKSNCISVTPIETEFGRKRQIDQSSCNKDFSCINGFCPSFVTVHGGTLRKLGGMSTVSRDPFVQLPPPKAPALQQPYGIVITGIGGTGIITLGALLGRLGQGFGERRGNRIRHGFGKLTNLGKLTNGGRRDGDGVGARLVRHDQRPRCRGRRAHMSWSVRHWTLSSPPSPSSDSTW